MFWLISITLLAAAGLMLAWPLLARGSQWRAFGLAVLLTLPLGGALLYREAGTPNALDLQPAGTESADFDALADDLRNRLSERPEDLEGWLLLGRSLKSLQRFAEAREALETAYRIAPENPLVMVELAEARLFASGQQTLGDDSRDLLQAALAQDPGLQKGVWLLGIDAAQRGDDATAVEYWQRLLELLGPDSEVAPAVREQISLARTRLGETAEAASVEASAWAGIEVTVGLSDTAAAALPAPLPDAAVLFVIARSEGQLAGPPLGVVRVDQPRFPLELTIDDDNAMIPQRRLSDQPGLRIVARLSLSGQPGASAGDWESEAVDLAPDSPEIVTLSLIRPVD